MYKEIMVSFREDWKRFVLAAGLAAALISGARAQECYSGSEIDGPTAKALQAAAEQYFGLSARGDVAGLKANAVPEVAANFGAIEKAVVNNKSLFAQEERPEPRLFVLDARNSKTTWPRADFYCGIYNSPDRVGISIPNLPPGRYAMTIAEGSGKEPIMLTLVLEDAGNNSWKLGGYYARRTTLDGHDGQWYIAKAREFKNKSQLHNAWFYYLTAWDLLAPVDFMSTPALDKLSDETQAARPADLPSATAPLLLVAGGKNFAVTELSALPVNGELYVRAQYRTPDAANPTAASADNAEVIKAVLAKYPEMRAAFGGAVARATDTAGHDFGTVTPMKDVK
jgi:hypothetical protein